MLLEQVRDSGDIEEIYSGNLAVRLASTDLEIEEAQGLRYQVFYNEIGGVPSEEMRKHKRDFDIFDGYCDHLLVLDRDAGNKVVGTYRLLRRSRMGDLKNFYSEGEFDINPLKKEQGEILELGRSCVDMNYRSRSAMQLLWRGIAAYANKYDIKLMFGCASLYGQDVKEHTLALSYLYHYHMAPEDIRAVALPHRYIEMNLMPKDEVDVKKAFSVLPALVKGYLRLNAYIGMGAVIDAICNTTDVAVVVKTDLVTQKYIQRYLGAKSE